MKFPIQLLVLIFAASPILKAEPDLFTSAFINGKITINARLRYETVEQTQLNTAEAFTLRTRVGFTTATWLGLKAQIEAENITAADGDRYSQSGLNPAAKGRAVVADPEASEINQLWLAYSVQKTTATIGRQRINLDNARFIGDVGWRQNMQTYDALVVQNKSFTTATLTYAYLDQINRVFGPTHPLGKWRSDSHVLHANYGGLSLGTLAAYVYLLDFKNAAANSCATEGVSLTGSKPLSSEFNFTYRAELATQSATGYSPLYYKTTYDALDAGLTWKSAAISLGYEQLGSDHNIGFKTPLATLHAFNGWADLFLNTPAAGLRDTYIKATYHFPAKLDGTFFWHRFTTDATTTRLGDESDAQLIRKFGKSLTAILKFADFRSSRAASYANVQKLWAQLDYEY